MAVICVIILAPKSQYNLRGALSVLIQFDAILIEANQVGNASNKPSLSSCKSLLYAKGSDLELSSKLFVNQKREVKKRGY